jgi:hypothetical protein
LFSKEQKMDAEKVRLKESRNGTALWKKWGPYLSERQWGTVREDYSPFGDAWEYFPHEHARSRAYRWGEDGIGGLSDDRGRLCFAIALWNGRDPILKERLFGLTGKEGNHGEDVKECYFYLDSTPTHSYMKMLYKYPHAEFPYHRLVKENLNRGRQVPEFELLDTGIFGDDQYYDVFIEYAKASAEDILIRLTVENRGAQGAEMQLLPHLWFRNTWSWGRETTRPTLRVGPGGSILADHWTLGPRWLYFEGEAPALFCENQTNVRRLYGVDDGQTYYKDGINDFVVHGEAGAVNSQVGTKAALQYRLQVPAGGSRCVRLRLCAQQEADPFGGFQEVFSRRQSEADEFYAELQDGMSDEDARRVHRQALAGMLWSKQCYHYDVRQWLEGDPGQPPPPRERLQGRNHRWVHLKNAEVISMPDKWEYPWYAAWDLAFHTLSLSIVDPDFAKEQLVLLTHEWFMHPNGQLPAYEWNFSGVNPPLHAWAAWRVYKIDQKKNGGVGDQGFLERVFLKLLLNFTWWVNREDAEGRNIFQGGFLGLDNIGPIDRSAALPSGEEIEQADGTSWMAMYSLNMMRIALELSTTAPVYQDLATKFFEHFLYIAGAMADIGGAGIDLWDEEDQFFYDVLRMKDGSHCTLKVRSMVGLTPLFAVEVLEPDLVDRLPEFKKRMEWFLKNRKDLADLVSRWQEPGVGERRLLSLLRGHRMKRLLARLLDPSEFLSDHGVRSLSRSYGERPYEFRFGGKTFTVTYAAAESDSGLFGGNSNWRGPVWFPVNFMIIEALQRFHHYYGEEFLVECPTGSGRFLTIEEISLELTARLTKLFLRDEQGRRAIFGSEVKLQTDPHFRDYLPFHEYFHGDDGRGLGASHQTGWTGLVAKLLQPRERERAGAVSPRMRAPSNGTVPGVD